MAQSFFNKGLLLGSALLCFFSACQRGGVEHRATAVSLPAEAPNEITSRSDLLAAYGWTTPAQQRALCQLLQHASVQIETDQLDKKLALEENLTWLLRLIRETQAKFWNRQGGKERWQVGPLPWMEIHKQSSWACLKTLGFVQAVEPTQGAQGTVCLLGASKGRMQARLQFLKGLVQSGKLQPKTLVLLSGERFVTEKIDGSREELERIAQRFQRESWQKVTEMDVLRYLINQDHFFRSFKVVVVDVGAHKNPDGRTTRPTTQSTVAAWLAQHPQNGPVFFISNQPHVQAQDAGIRSVFASTQTQGFEVYTLGEAFAPKVEPTAEMVKQGVEALGGTLRTLAPVILARQGITLPTSLKEEFSRLYQNDPYLTVIVQSL